MTSALLSSAFVFGYGGFTMMMYAVRAILNGTFFKGTTEKETLELQMARNRFWDLSKKWSAFSHQIHTLRNGFKFHYVCNEPNAATRAAKPLVIFIHGFPDSWALWRHMLNVESLQGTATLVAVDLPGFGGSDSLDRYSATAVLENLTEFILAMRAKYGIDSNGATSEQRTVIVGHDWGCLLSMRLAAEAPELANRFIVTNAPIVPLVFSNIRRRLASSLKMLKSFLRAPIHERSLLVNAIKSLVPVVRQVWSSGYVAVFQLPPALVSYVGTGGNQSFLKYAHKTSYGKQKFSIVDAAECMASSSGPSIHESKTQTADGEGYAGTAITRRAASNFFEMCRYYREGTAVARWKKSVETVAGLHDIAQGTGIQRTSSGGGLFDEGPRGALKARATVVWGQKDHALVRQLCLDGISDYLTKGSQVIELPNSAHWTPLEREGQVALTKAVEWAVKGEHDDIGMIVGDCCPGATVTIRK
ncbi:alpha/beta fold hydrolase [Aspergillus puulaauensis]|uniref:AB hydrolase-1 domain-containing protein n=1 Tax=Aspergillus puulaauensis TaxID=1220207 RepID=A0A7R7XMD5_9EURO|nr:uncharacterized protein APUU_40266S [Aspergillus puulaauensis]BCS23822.1 hypothetical protein APUU_40266S [Aspergillus puulaauensis]